MMGSITTPFIRRCATWMLPQPLLAFKIQLKKNVGVNKPMKYCHIGLTQVVGYVVCGKSHI